MSKKKMVRVTLSEEDWQTMNSAVDNEISALNYLDPEDLDDEDVENLEYLNRLYAIEIKKVEEL